MRGYNNYSWEFDDIILNEYYNSDYDCRGIKYN